MAIDFDALRRAVELPPLPARRCVLEEMAEKFVGTNHADILQRATDWINGRLREEARFRQVAEPVRVQVIHPLVLSELGAGMAPRFYSDPKRIAVDVTDLTDSELSHITALMNLPPEPI